MNYRDGDEVCTSRTIPLTFAHMGNQLNLADYELTHVPSVEYISN
jgi:hypothetical protein